MSKLKLIYISATTVCLFLVNGCAFQGPNKVPEIKYVQANDFNESEAATIQVESDFTLDLWAPGPLLSNAVAISIDNQGAAYVSETRRRKSSDLDIREHRDWMTEDLGLSNLEETKAFHLAKLATELSEQNTWQEDFNGDSIHDFRDLEVQSEYIRKIWDSDGDGRADASCAFAEGFNSMLTGVAAGILHNGENVYLTAAPDVWKLKDTDKDGDADEREVISHGFGIHIAYAGHDMSGLTMGPDGKVYWSIGDMGVHVTDQNGKVWDYPHEGAVMRCNPDGSDFEVFAHGLRNPQEIAFDAHGNLISVDNDGDHPGEHERYVHILEGSDSGWRIYWQYGKYNEKNEDYKIWTDEKLHLPHFEGQAAYLLPPLALSPDGPAGLAYNPGTALGKKWNNFFFGSYFKGSAAQSQIQAFRLEPKGASFSVAEEKDVVKGVVSTGLAFGPGGELYINDWKEGYAKKPEGRIWELDVADNPNPMREQTKKLLQEGMKGKNSEELSELLAYGDMRVRMAAQFELVKRSEIETLKEIASDDGEQLARLHAIWGIGQLIRSGKNDGEQLIALLKDGDSEVKAQAAKVLGEGKVEAAKDALLAALDDEAPRVQFFAVESLGKMGESRAFDKIVKMLEDTGDDDPHMRHGLVYALSRLASEDQLQNLASYPSVDVRLGAIVALREQGSAAVASFLEDDNIWVLEETARAIHDDKSIEEALPALARALEKPGISSEIFLRRAINANLRLGGSENAKRLAAYAANMQAPLAMRTDALWALGYWSDPPKLDRVEGRYRDLPARETSEAYQALAQFGPALLAQSAEIKSAVIEAAGRVKDNTWESIANEGITNKREPASVRRASLNTLAALESKQLVNGINLALESSDIDLRKDAQALMGDLDLEATTIVQMLDKVLTRSSVEEKQQAFSSLSKVKDASAESLLGEWLTNLEQAKVDPALQLDVLMAVENSSFEELKKRKSVYEAAKPEGDMLAKYSESLYGGNARKGQRLFLRNNSAQCIRCHVIQGYGGAVGPELTEIHSVLTREQLLESMVDPSARLAPGYGSVALTLNDGSTANGIIKEENQNSIVILDAEGGDREIKFSDIKERQNAPSAMPSMAGVLDAEELRDLVAFLVQLK